MTKITKDQFKIGQCWKHDYGMIWIRKIQPGTMTIDELHNGKTNREINIEFRLLRDHLHYCHAYLTLSPGKIWKDLNEA